MKKPKIHNIIMCSVFMMLTLPFCAMVQGEEMAPIPHHKEPYVVESGARENLGEETSTAFSDTVVIPGVPWMQLHFGDFNLGEKSYITMTSLHDGSHQRLDAQTILQWRNSSAYFNGDSVDVVLNVAPGESGIFFSILEVTVGEWVGEDKFTEDILPESQCGANDDRVSSSAPAIGRIMPIGCTGWIVSNRANLTAGHCISANTTTLQFNVPASLCDGTTQNPPAQDQYPIEAIANIDFFNDGAGAIGNDWAVFETFANANGDLAIHRQGAFYRMSRDTIPANVRVTGYGVDNVPLGCTNFRNASSQTQQTHSGSYLGETIQGVSDVFIEYTVDTEGGNSGGPVISTANGLTLGIHTNAGCNPPGAGNTGTGFEHNNLENAIQTFPGTNVEYVDRLHPVGSENGTVFRPFNTVQEGVNAASSGAIVSVVTGSYNETVTINKAVTLQAPVGVVTIIGQ